jgi:hypothetical protein
VLRWPHVSSPRRRPRTPTRPTATSERQLPAAVNGHHRGSTLIWAPVQRQSLPLLCSHGRRPGPRPSGLMQPVGGVPFRWHHTNCLRRRCHYRENPSRCPARSSSLFPWRSCLATHSSIFSWPWFSNFPCRYAPCDSRCKGKATRIFLTPVGEIRSTKVPSESVPDSRVSSGHGMGLGWLMATATPRP